MDKQQGCTEEVSPTFWVGLSSVLVNSFLRDNTVFSQITVENFIIIVHGDAYFLEISTIKQTLLAN